MRRGIFISNLSFVSLSQSHPAYIPLMKKFKSQNESQQDKRNKAYYPRLEQRSMTSHNAVKLSKVTDLDSLWMEGFLHHEELEIEKKVCQNFHHALLTYAPIDSIGTLAFDWFAQHCFLSVSLIDTFLQFAHLKGPDSLSVTSHEKSSKAATSNHRENYVFSKEDQRRLIEAQKRHRKKSKHQHPLTKKSPYTAPIHRAAVGRGKYQIRSKLMEVYFETNRNEIEVRTVCMYHRVTIEWTRHFLSTDLISTISYEFC